MHSESYGGYKIWVINSKLKQMSLEVLSKKWLQHFRWMEGRKKTGQIIGTAVQNKQELKDGQMWETHRHHTHAHLLQLNVIFSKLHNLLSSWLYASTTAHATSLYIKDSTQLYFAYPLLWSNLQYACIHVQMQDMQKFHELEHLQCQIKLEKQYMTHSERKSTW